MNVSLGVWAAFLAGFLSFFSPCVLPLVPVYMGYIMGQGGRMRERISEKPVLYRLGKTAMFVAGFSVVFILMGGLAGFFGFYMFQRLPWLIQASGIIIISFGVIIILGALDIKLPGFISRQKRLNILDTAKKAPFLRKILPFVLGISFGLAWTPCIGPILGGILTLAFSSQTAGRGTLLLGVYSAGIAIPFLISSVFIGKINFIFGKSEKIFMIVQILSGIILIFFGILAFTGSMVRLVAWFIDVLPFYEPYFF